MKKEKEAFHIQIDTLGYFIHRAYYMMVKMLNKELKAHNLKLQHSDFAIMMVLKEIGAASQTQLSEIQGKERSGVSRSLIALEKEGYIVRTPFNGKTNKVTLSEKGLELMPLLTEIANNVTDSALKGFSKQSRAGLINNLHRIYLNSLIYLVRK